RADTFTDFSKCTIKICCLLSRFINGLFDFVAHLFNLSSYVLSSSLYVPELLNPRFVVKVEFFYDLRHDSKVSQPKRWCNVTMKKAPTEAGAHLTTFGQNYVLISLRTPRIRSLG